MPSSRWTPFAAAALLLLASPRAQAQRAAQGFAVDRFYPSASGGGWLVMDTLDMHGGLGGALSLTADDAHDPLRLSDGAAHLAVVSDEAIADIGGSISTGRFRFSLDIPTPLAVVGQSGVVQGHAFTAPVVDLGTRTDAVADARLGLVARLLGEATSRLRLGVGVQLYLPTGSRADATTDDTYRAMGRLLLAGDEGRFTYAAQLGLHLRPLDEHEIPGSPRGHELLYGAAAGASVSLGGDQAWRAVVGPELFGASALRAFDDARPTALEALLSARLEGTREGVMQTRIKLGIGGGLTHQFGAPDVRIVLGVEAFGFKP